MTRRSPVATLLRVAELQEAVARGGAGRALAAAREATAACEVQLAHLSSAGLAGGTRTALETSSQVRLLRAESVHLAEAALAQAQQLQDEAVRGWTAARQKHQLVTELAARKHAEAAALQDKRDQRLADDLASLRRVPR